MSADERTLGDLFREAAGDDRAELDLGGGLRVGLSVGGVLVALDQDGGHKELSELPSHVVEDLTRELRRAADDKYVDPARNEFIKLEPD